MKEYSAYIIYRKEWALKWVFLMSIFLGVSAFANFYLISRSLAIIFLALAVGSFLFIKSMMNYFTRKVRIRLYENELSIKVLKLKDDKEEDFFEFPFSDMKSYSIKFPTSNFACLRMTLHSGIKKEFSFLTRRLNESQTEKNEIIESIHSTLQHFNSKHKEAIKFEPSFLASQKGLVVISSLIFLSIIVIALAFKFDKNLPATFAGTLLIIGQLLLARATDLRFYKRMIIK